MISVEEQLNKVIVKEGTKLRYIEEMRELFKLAGVFSADDFKVNTYTVTEYKEDTVGYTLTNNEDVTLYLIDVIDILNAKNKKDKPLGKREKTLLFYMYYVWKAFPERRCNDDEAYFYLTFAEMCFVLGVEQEYWRFITSTVNNLVKAGYVERIAKKGLQANGKRYPTKYKVNLTTTKLMYR